MGELWKVKSARVKGEYLVIVAEKEIPLSKILDNEVLEEKPEAITTPEEEEEVSDEEAGRRLGIGEEEEEEETSASPEEVMERAGVLQDKIEEVEMKIAPVPPVSKIKGQKGRILASIDNGNETLAEISNDAKIGQGSVSGQLTWLTKNGFAKRAGRGQYGITAKGKSYLKKLEAA